MNHQLDKRPQKRLRTAVLAIVVMALALAAVGVQAPTATAQSPADSVPLSGSISTGTSPLVDVSVTSSIDTITTNATGAFSLQGASGANTLVFDMPQSPTLPAFDFNANGVQACPDGFSPDLGLGGMCASATPASQGPETCPAGALGQPDGCYINVPQIPGTPTCPPGSLMTPGGKCHQPVDAVTIPDVTVCPPGAFGTPPGCYISVPQIPGAVTCTDGVLFGGNVCVITGPPPAAELMCPISTTVFEDADGCYQLVAALPDCPVDTTPVADDLCRQDVALVWGPKVCPVDFSFIDNTCVRLENPLTDPPTCPPGSLMTPGGKCHQPVDAVTIPGQTTCPPEAFGTPPACYINVPAIPGTPTCPLGTVPHLDGLCNKPVANAAGEYFCYNADAVLTGKQCVTTAGFQFLNVTLPPVVQLTVVVDDGTGCATGATPCEQYAINTITDITPVAQPAKGVTFSKGSSSSGGWTTNNTAELPVFDSAALQVSVTGPNNVSALAQWDGSNPFTVVLDNAPEPVLCDGKVVTINMQEGASGIGTNGDDVILGTNGSDTIVGRGGADTICALGGRDFIWSGSGDDVVLGGGGRDTIRGGNGNDDLHGNGGNDSLHGGNGNDDLRGDGGNDSIRGNGGADTIFGGDGNDNVRGNGGADTIRGGDGNDDLRGNGGDDDVRGQGGNDTCRGGNGTNTVLCEISL